MLELRDYQLKMIAQAKAEMQKGHRSICLTAPTGSGKTALAVHMLHTAANKGMPSWFICHRREILKQTTMAFALEGLKHGVISAGFFEDRRQRVQIASVQTLIRRYKRFPPPKLIVVDECHHIASKSWSELFRQFPNTFFIGLSATPSRLDGQGLADYFSSLVVGPSVQSLIEQGYLSPYKLYAPMKMNIGGVHTRMGDFVRSELSNVADRPSIIGSAVEHYKKYAYGKRALVFAVSIQHSKHVVEQFQAAGYSAKHIDGETPMEERDEAITRFREGNIQVLSNVELCGEGFDIPAIEAVILLRPTQSLSLYLQQIGRALRPAEGKDVAIILDHTGNCERFGLPDEERVWSLEGLSFRGSKNQTESVSVKVCPKCFAAQVAGRPSCKFCGFVFDIKPREVEEKEGQLGEVDVEIIRRNRAREQAGAESLEELTRIGVSRGYKFPRRWAWFVFKARQAKKLGKVA